MKSTRFAHAPLESRPGRRAAPAGLYVEGGRRAEQVHVETVPPRRRGVAEGMVRIDGAIGRGKTSADVLPVPHPYLLGPGSIEDARPQKRAGHSRVAGGGAALHEAVQALSSERRGAVPDFEAGDGAQRHVKARVEEGHRNERKEKTDTCVKDGLRAVQPLLAAHPN